MKHYSTFKEIDSELKILALQRDIAKEELELKWHQLKYSFKPSNIALQVTHTLKKSILYFLASAAVHKLRSARNEKALT